MKKYFASLLVLLVCFTSFGMKRAISDISTQSTQSTQSKAESWINAGVRVYFAPTERQEIFEQLMNLLDSAQTRVLVAMYWIKSNRIVDKLISIRKKGVNVQVIFDESLDSVGALVDKFLKYDITPVVFLSKTMPVFRKMHNKFIVIDDSIVFTGSGNLTKTVFDLESSSSNYENIVVINSQQIAREFIKNFVFIKENIFRSYINILANRDLAAGKIWTLSRYLYQKDYMFQRVLLSLLPALSVQQQTRLWNALDLDEKRRQLLTDKQKYFLKERGVSIRGMSRSVAITLIKIILRIGWKGVHHDKPGSEPSHKRTRIEKR